MFLLTFIKAVALFGQQTNWFLAPHVIDFQTGTASTLPTVPFPDGGSGNSLYIDGVLQFYIYDGSLYNGASNLVYQYYGSGYRGKEVVIVPVPNRCNTYCVLQTGHLCGGYPEEDQPGYDDKGVLMYEVLVENGQVMLMNTPTWSQNDGTNNDLDNFFSCEEVVIALSRPINELGERNLWLRTSFSTELVKFKMSATNGLVLDQIYTINSPNDNSGYSPKYEMELSPDGKWLAWSSNSEVVLINLEDNPFMPKYFPSVSYGLEFDKSSEYLYYTDFTQGISRVNLGFGNTTPLFNTLDFGNSQIELGKDGRLYVARKDGYLHTLDGLNPPVPSPYNIILTPTNALSADMIYWLPDQVDGEDYNSTFGDYPIVGNSGSINSVVLPNLFDANSAPIFMNCEPILFFPDVEGPASTITMHLFSVDPITGTQVSGGNYLDYNWSLPLYGTTFDLRCLPLVSCDLFNNAISNGHFYFGIEAKLSNRCESAELLGYFSVQDGPPPADVNLQVNNGITGIPCNASTNFQNPCLSGYASSSINIANSQGDIDWYQIEIDEIDCVTGAVISQIYTGAEVPVINLSSLTALSLNGLTINGNTGYFNSPSWLNRCVKVKVTMGNICGSSSEFSFVKFNGNYFAGNNNGMNLVMMEPNLTTIISPNPFTNIVHVKGYVVNDETLRFRFTDGMGRVVLDNTESVFSGDYSISLDGTNLPSGSYILSCSSTSGTKRLHVIKM